MEVAYDLTALCLHDLAQHCRARAVDELQGKTPAGQPGRCLAARRSSRHTSRRAALTEPKIGRAGGNPAAQLVVRRAFQRASSTILGGSQNPTPPERASLRWMRNPDPLIEKAGGLLA
jgi:hypothetical protein